MFTDVEALIKSCEGLAVKQQDGLKSLKMIREEFALRLKQIQDASLIFPTLEDYEYYIVLSPRHPQAHLFMAGHVLTHFYVSFPIAPLVLTATTKKGFERQVRDFERSCDVFYQQGLQQLEKYKGMLSRCRQLHHVSLDVVLAVSRQMHELKTECQKLKQDAKSLEQWEEYENFMAGICYRIALIEEELERRLLHGR